MTNSSHDLVLEISEIFTRCQCGGHVRLLRDKDGELVVEHQDGRLHCIHRNVIVLGIAQWINDDFIRN